MPIPKPPYPAAFRQQIVELVRAVRGFDELARDFGCNASSIHHWINAAAGANKGGSGSGSGSGVGGLTLSADAPLSASERQELLELRRKLKQVRLERDILAKATAWFAGKSERTFTTSSSS